MYQQMGLPAEYIKRTAISLHAPAAPDGRPLLDAGAVAQLRPGSLVVNTARAGLVDAEALLAALANGHVAGLALDVFDLEPPTDRRLAGHDRVSRSAAMTTLIPFVVLILPHYFSLLPGRNKP